MARKRFSVRVSDYTNDLAATLREAAVLAVFLRQRVILRIRKDGGKRR